ncbi:MAG: hypothetical protein NC342_01130 [Pseudoflavonifractor sp.]|nr:hypothetical protein [Alloprevotella sp.]MCM1116126.1 hypothetical protein [Pseudoflavonifractor sp.]
MTLINLHKTLLAATAALTVAAAAAFDREGLIVPYAEDHFPDMAAMRYDRSPFYRAIERATDSASLPIPAEWAGKRIVVGVGYPSDTFALPSLTINGHLPGKGFRPLRWDVTSLAKPGHSVTLKGLGKMPRRVYAYATPTRVYVDSYHISSSLDSADLSKGLFEVDIHLGGIKKTDPSIAIEYMLFDAGRHQVAAGRTDASPHIRFKARIPNIRPWSTDDPYRYMLAIILRDDRTGKHLMTVGSPLRFANYRADKSHGPELNGTVMAPLALAALDSLPASPDARIALVRDLRAAGANAVIAPPGIDPDTDWRNYCADGGILCYADGSLDPMTLFAADPADAERPQQPGGLEKMADRYIRVATELTDTATLTITATTRSPFARLSDFTLDYEFITPDGRKLTSSDGVVIPGDPRTPVAITLFPPLPAQGSILPDDMPEAYLNVTWRPLRPMAGAIEGEPTGMRQFIIGAPERLTPANERKLKHKGAEWRGGKSSFTLPSATGLPASIKINGNELLSRPCGISLDGIPMKANATSITYDSPRRSAVASIEIVNPSNDMAVGKATIAYSITDSGDIDITIRDATPGAALTFPAPADRIYLGRGPGNAPASATATHRIALYHDPAPSKTTRRETHSATRHLTLLPSSGPHALKLTFDTPGEIALDRHSAAVSLNGPSFRLSAIPFARK